MKVKERSRVARIWSQLKWRSTAADRVPTLPRGRIQVVAMDTETNHLALSDNAVLLLAANFASVPQVTSLAALVAGYPDVLHFLTVLEILLKILPETTSPEDYLPLVYRSYRKEPDLLLDWSKIPMSAVDQVSTLSAAILRRRLAAFNLQLSPPTTQVFESLLSQWFFDRARKVEDTTGMIDLARRLVLPERTPSYAQSPPFPPAAVIAWGKGVIQVLETFIFDNDDEDELQLVQFESLDADSAVRLLLSRTTPESVARNVKTLVVPFVLYILEKDPGRPIWEPLWEWLLDRAVAGELECISHLSADWPSIDEFTLRDFLRTCLTACYISHQSSPSIRHHLRRIEQNIVKLSHPLGLQESESISLSHPETDLLPSQLRESSPLTTMSSTAIQFLDQIISSADIVAQYSPSEQLSLHDIVMVREGPQQKQTDLVDRVLRADPTWTKRTEDQWNTLRQSLKWLQQSSKVLGKVSLESIDVMVFSCMLDATGVPCLINLIQPSPSQEKCL
jgi:Secretory pathway protein Sec39